jgi:hypothetical protein
MCRSPSRTYNASSTPPASKQPSRIACPFSRFPTAPPAPIPPGIRRAIAATRHLLEMYRRGLPDQKTRSRLQRLDHRLLAVADQLDRITAEK